jgi:hypothetical protein
MVQMHQQNLRTNQDHTNQQISRSGVVYAKNLLHLEIQIMPTVPPLLVSNNPMFPMNQQTVQQHTFYRDTSVNSDFSQTQKQPTQTVTGQTLDLQSIANAGGIVHNGFAEPISNRYAKII